MYFEGFFSFGQYLLINFYCFPASDNENNVINLYLFG